MTIKEKLQQMIYERGVFERYAAHVLDNYVDNKALVEVYHKPWSDYPPQFHAVAWLTTMNVVIDWMDAEMPMHFARSLFDAERVTA